MEKEVRVEPDLHLRKGNPGQLNEEKFVIKHCGIWFFQMVRDGT